MLSVDFLRANEEAVLQGFKKRGASFDKTTLGKIYAWDDLRKKVQSTFDLIQMLRKETAQRMHKPLSEAKKHTQLLLQSLKEIEKIAQSQATPSQEAKKESIDLKEIIERLSQGETLAKDLKQAAKVIDPILKEAKEDLRQHLLALPNVPHASVPKGSSAADNSLLRESKLPLSPLSPPSAKSFIPHWKLMPASQLDFERARKVSGAGFVFYRRELARLQRALINWCLDEGMKAGYEEVVPPLVVGEEAAEGTGQLPDKDKQMYQLREEDLYLIPTAEVPLTNMLCNEVLDAKALPLRFIGHTPCFRREAGSWGADVRGLNRLHQFDKVEIVQCCAPEESYDRLDGMVSYVEALLEKLEIPWRSVRLCAGDLGFAAACTIDFELYAAGQKRWLEVSSVSNFESFQSRRMRLRYRSEGKEKRLAFPHTLNGSALAMPRLLAALLEYGQQKSILLYLLCSRITLVLIGWSDPLCKADAEVCIFVLVFLLFCQNHETNRANYHRYA